MTHRWRTLPDDAPRGTIVVLWCLAVFAVIVIGIAAVGLSFEFPRAARETELWLSVLIGMALPILAVSSWGLVLRRFAFGSAWIGVTLTVAALVSGGFAALVAIDARGKDSIGHGLVLLFGTPLLFLSMLIASGIAYGLYWKRRFRHVSLESLKPSTERTNHDLSRKEGFRNCRCVSRFRRGGDRIRCLGIRDGRRKRRRGDRRRSCPAAHGVAVGLVLVRHQL